MNQCLTIGLMLVGLTYVLAHTLIKRKSQQKIPEIDGRCLNCICQGSSNCNETFRCHNAGNKNVFCGPYIISYAYWCESGRPGDKGNADDFITCLNSKTCSERSIRGYMRRFGRDCDGNGDIDCYDFSRIHKLGYVGCRGDAILNTEYWEKFEICYAGYDTNYDINDWNYDGPNDDYGDTNDGTYNGANDDCAIF